MFSPCVVLITTLQIDCALGDVLEPCFPQYEVFGWKTLITNLVAMGSAAWFGPNRPRLPRPSIPVLPYGFLWEQKKESNKNLDEKRYWKVHFYPWRKKSEPVFHFDQNLMTKYMISKSNTVHLNIKLWIC